MKRNEDSLRDLWYNIKCTNIHMIGVPERAERQKGIEKLFEEIIVENFPNMWKETVTKVQEMEKPRQDKPKDEHDKTHSNQIHKKTKNIKSNEAKATSYIQGNPQNVISWLINPRWNYYNNCNYIYT